MIFVRPSILLNYTRFVRCTFKPFYIITDAVIEVSQTDNGTFRVANQIGTRDVKIQTRKGKEQPLITLHTPQTLRPYQNTNPIVICRNAWGNYIYKDEYLHDYINSFNQQMIGLTIKDMDRLPTDIIMKSRRKSIPTITPIERYEIFTHGYQRDMLFDRIKENNALYYYIRPAVRK